MGCASSKRVEVAEDEVYRPPPASIAYFDISTIGEPWLITTTTADSIREKGTTTHLLPLPILEKVDGYDLPPQSWSEVSKALEDLKPTLTASKPEQPPPRKEEESPVPAANTTTLKSPTPSKSQQSFRTLEELDAQAKGARPRQPPPPKNHSSPPPLPSGGAKAAAVLPDGLRPVTQNSFLLRDREEREKGKSDQGDHQARIRRRRDPFEGLPELCPPGGAESVVLYTTSLRGVRRTFEDCEKARQVLDLQCPAGVDVDERDVSLHGEYLKELRELLGGGEGAGVPRLFVKGRYVGGAEEVVGLNEVGRVGEMLRFVRRKGEKGGGRRGCEGCGGARFVPCFECNGSCKVVGEGEEGVVRCGECNENGLVHCPLCY